MTSNSLNTVIKALDKAGALPYVVFVGSWAQYIYSQTIFPGYYPNVKTRDIDIMYTDLKIPATDLPVVKCLTENGFKYVEDPYSGVAKFYGNEEAEVEFLTRSIPSKERAVYTIKQLGIKSEGLRDMNILTEHTAKVMFMGKSINVPEPAAYILQKLLGLQNRKPEIKREKDVSSAEALLQYISNDPVQLDRLYSIYDTLTKHEKEKIDWAINTYGNRYDFSLLHSCNIKERTLSGHDDYNDRDDYDDIEP